LSFASSTSSTNQAPEAVSEAAPIGVFDSGVGGLTTVRKLVNVLPNERVLYLGDTARVPYGNKSPRTVTTYTEEAMDFLSERHVKLIIIACNTASAMALEAAERRSPVPVVGVIEPAAEAALQHTLQHGKGRIGIIGTRATVQSGAYSKAVARLLAQQAQAEPAQAEPAQAKEGANVEVEVIAEACPLFVPFAEEGWHYHPATRLVAEEYLASLKKADIDTLILGCTHYPMLADVIQDVLPNVRLINSGEEAVRVAQTILQKQAALREQTENSLRGGDVAHTSRVVECYVTDKSTAFGHVAERFLGFPLALVQQISVAHG
jgi:glutamate racemase